MNDPIKSVTKFRKDFKENPKALNEIIMSNTFQIGGCMILSKNNLTKFVVEIQEWANLRSRQ